MNFKIKLFVFLITTISVITVAEARCRKVQVCNDFGMNCKVKQLCESSLDLPSIELAPLQPLPSTRLKPLPSVSLPPLGTSKCEHKQVNGFWQNICK